jgi:hypothetical protein
MTSNDNDVHDENLYEYQKLHTGIAAQTIDYESDDYKLLVLHILSQRLVSNLKRGTELVIHFCLFLRKLVESIFSVQATSFCQIPGGYSYLHSLLFKELQTAAVWCYVLM